MAGSPFKYRITILGLSCLFMLSFSQKMSGQSLPDTLRIPKEYPRVIPKMEFDSARISTNGRYALVLKGNYLNGCDINYWNLYENGFDNTLLEYIVIHEGMAYFLTYEKEEAKDIFAYEQNYQTYIWDVTKKCPIEELIDQYDLRLKPKNRSREMKVTFETLPSVKMRIPNQFDDKTEDDYIERMAQRFEIKFEYNKKLIHTAYITYLSTPEPSVYDYVVDFDVYYKKIQQNIRQSIYWNEEGLLFLESGDTFFLQLKLDSAVFSGYMYHSGGFMFSHSYSPEARFTLFCSNP